MELTLTTILSTIVGLALFANFFGTLGLLKTASVFVYRLVINVLVFTVAVTAKVAMMAANSMKKTHIEYRTKRGSIILAEETVAAPNQARQGSVYDSSVDEVVTGSVVDEDFFQIGKDPRQGHTIDGQTVTHSLPSKGLRK